MTYTQDAHIESVNDVEAFFHHLVGDHKVNFHPDDNFADYISIEAKTPSFTNDEVSLYNRLMDACFDVCETVGVDIYEMAISAHSKTTL